MKNFIVFVIAVFSITLVAKAQSSSATSYVALVDSAHDNKKMLEGIITKNDLINDPAFNNWYAESQRIYPRPDADAVAAFSKNRDKIYFLIFGGTWCEDTHFILPKFYKTLEASGFPENRVTVFAVNHKMATTGNLAKALNITHTPTIVVMRDGKELGRVVEYGKSGHWEKELTEIINQ